MAFDIFARPAEKSDRPKQEAPGSFRYGRFVLIWSKTADSFVPVERTPAMITIAISAAIRPYSIAVAPASSWMNFLKDRFNDNPLVLRRSRVRQPAWRAPFLYCNEITESCKWSYCIPETFLELAQLRGVNYALSISAI